MGDAKLLLKEGIRLLRRGRMSKARDIIQDALAEAPDDPATMSYMGLVTALADHNFEGAEDFCAMAIEKEPENAQAHANLAWVLHLQDKRKEAVESLERALSFDAKNRDALRIRERLGVRQRPPIPGLARSNPINRSLGKAVRRLKKSR